VRRWTPLGLALAASLVLPNATVASNCNGTQTGLVPLTALGTGTYQGYPGGLYPGGSNVRPAAHDAAGLALAAAIAPRDTSGSVDPNGRIVFISIGMSNTTQEFSTFVPAADDDAYKDPRVKVIDCAKGGQTASLIKDPSYAYWDTVRTRLRGHGSAPAQVQVVWLKEANAGPTTGFPAATLTLMRDLGSVARVLHDEFPNLAIVYLSSRIYAGYATSSLNPEPYAYESGFAVKWLIEAQITGVDSLNFDPGQGAVESPWLAWGPYLWADGVNPRPGDGLTWVCSDFATSDGTHPATGARIKVTDLLLTFLHQDETAQKWYVVHSAGLPLPPPYRELVVAPIPARDGIDISFFTPAGARWRVEVLDLTGRRVRALEDGLGDGSQRSVRWDARDASGARAPAGVYWVRFVAGGSVTTRRLALLDAH
jgi:hypothetical protein